MLEALYPGRIDLGVGRAPGGDMLADAALRPNYGAPAVDNFPRQLADLIGFLGDGLEPEHPLARVKASPRDVPHPDLWMLGSSDQGAAFAAHFGLAFSFAHFISEQSRPEVMHYYRSEFRPSARLDKPVASVAVSVICADTEEQARYVASSRDFWRVRRRLGYDRKVPTPEEALAYSYSDMEIRLIEDNRARQVIGTPEQVKAGLTALAQSYGVDEVMAVTICHDFSARLRSYELLAQVFGLNPRG